MNRSSSVVFLSLGTNIGIKSNNLEQAIEQLKKIPQTIVLQVSKFYKTAAWGKTDQPDFLNAVLSIQTFLDPEVLLTKFVAIELNMGRVRSVHWGPRLIDIDILFYGNLIFKSELLTIPHPELQNRKFVLVPLNEIAPQLMHPILKKTIAQLINSCPDQLEIVDQNKLIQE